MSTGVGGTTSDVVELNVGGVIYATSSTTLTKVPDSLLGQLFLGGGAGATPVAGTGPGVAARDRKGRRFIDRDGVLFRFVLDYLRNDERLVLPECFHERDRLRQEAEFLRLPGLVRSIQEAAVAFGGVGGFATMDVDPSHHHQQQQLRPPPLSLDAAGTVSNGTLLQAAAATGDGSASSPGGSPRGPREPGYVIVGYRGTFAFGRDGCQADVKFRKLWRILVSGRVALCREVFKDTLNESRDVDRGTTDRYTSRFFLKHMFLEQAFDMLLESGFRIVSSCGSGTNTAGETKPGMESEETKWNHYNEFVFVRP